MDECAIDNECHLNAQCTNTGGSYTCKCLDGYAGDGKNCTSKRLCVARFSMHNRHCSNTSVNGLTLCLFDKTLWPGTVGIF